MNGDEAGVSAGHFPLATSLGGGWGQRPAGVTFLSLRECVGISYLQRWEGKYGGTGPGFSLSPLGSPFGYLPTPLYSDTAPIQVRVPSAQVGPAQTAGQLPGSSGPAQLPQASSWLPGWSLPSDQAGRGKQGPQRSSTPLRSHSRAGVPWLEPRPGTCPFLTQKWPPLGLAHCRSSHQAGHSWRTEPICRSLETLRCFDN